MEFSANQPLKYLFRDDEVIALPGADVTRSLLFGCITIVTLAVISVRSFDPVSPYVDVSLVVLTITLVATLGSAMYAQNVLNLPMNRISDPLTLLKPKLLLNIAMTAYFLNIGMWIVVLGGILSSPFAALLSMSPIIYGLQLVYTTKEQELACQRFIEAYDRELNRSSMARFMQAYERHRYGSWSPFVVMFASLIVGAYQIDVFPNYEGGLAEVTRTEWYRFKYLLIYYISVVFAVATLIPSSQTRRISKEKLI